jgi:hypothetical protein
MQPRGLISNAYRTVSLSNPAVESEALGGQDVLGYRTMKNTLVPTGYAVGACADDPLDILIREEEAIEMMTW